MSLQQCEPFKNGELRLVLQMLQKPSFTDGLWTKPGLCEHKETEFHFNTKFNHLIQNLSRIFLLKKKLKAEKGSNKQQVRTAAKKDWQKWDSEFAVNQLQTSINDSGGFFFPSNCRYMYHDVSLDKKFEAPENAGATGLAYVSWRAGRSPNLMSVNRS